VSPTILINFGYGQLQLPEYLASVDVYPGEITFFNSKKVHCTTIHPGDSRTDAEEQRWAISYHFQEQLLGDIAPKKKGRSTDYVEEDARAVINDEAPHSQREERLKRQNLLARLCRQQKKEE